jgi:proline-specific peptidase
MTVDEGYIEIGGGHRLWYRRVGSSDATPLLVLHGGPGASFDYLEPIEALSAERPVVFYDQLGSGRSDHPDDDSLWTITRYADELDEVRAKLGLQEVHLFGHSWGGWLAIEYMTRGLDPSGVVSLVLGSTSSNLRQVAIETSRLRAELPEATPPSTRRRRWSSTGAMSVG